MILSLKLNLMKHFVFILLIYFLSACSIQKTERFAIFETSYLNKNQFENPYFDVDLNVEFEAPDGTKINHYGFYDGDQTWKIRFMPNKTGVWKYKAKFSDGTKTGSGKFECVKSDIKGPLTAYQKNPIWFGTQNGEPFLMRSFHVGDRFFAENWKDSLKSSGETRNQFLDWIEENKYNTLSIGSFFTNRDSEGRGKGWDTPEMWPLDYSEYQKAEVILDELAQRGLYIFPFAGFFGRDGNWPTDHQEQEKYIKYVIARWGAYYNLLFNVAGPEPLLAGEKAKSGYKNQMEIEDIDRLASLIKKYDDSNHLITVHNRTKASKIGDPFVNKNWYEFSTIQGPKTTDLKKHQNTIFKIRHPEKPYYAQETLWGGNMYHPDYGVENIRKIGIVLSMNAAMINFADNNGNSSSGFSGSLDFKDCKQNEHNTLIKVWDFFEKIPFGEMNPDTLISPSEFVLSGKNQILIYSEKQDSFQVKLSDDKIYRAEWINAQNTAKIREAGNIQTSKWIKTPDGGDDWFLKVYVEENSKK